MNNNKNNKGFLIRHLSSKFFFIFWLANLVIFFILYILNIVAGAISFVFGLITYFSEKIHKGNKLKKQLKPLKNEKIHESKIEILKKVKRFLYFWVGSIILFFLLIFLVKDFSEAPSIYTIFLLIDILIGSVFFLILLYLIIKNKFWTWLAITIFIFLSFFVILDKILEINDNQILTEKTNNSTNTLCKRTEPYDIAPEFQRAYSLILQRLSQSNYKEFQDKAKVLYAIRNCVEIKYAESENDLKGAEGVFYFYPDSDKERLQILVNPKYQVYDDLLTSILLIHELEHALNYSYANFNSNFKKMSCYEEEAYAYLQQLMFLFLLNQQERLSLTKRQTPETERLFKLMDKLVVTKYDGSLEINPMPYVTSHPYYQKQCEGR
jgi:hypothetical protein